MELEEEEERKSGSKRRAKQVQVGFDSDDDEPIKSLFKLKAKKRNPKKVKMGSGVVAVKGKAVEVWEYVNEDLGGMDDTLASFRKKLKDPNKESGSGLTVTAGRSLDASGAEPSGRYFVEGGGLVIESYDKDLVIGKDGSDLNVYKDSEIRVEEKVKRSKSSSKPKKTGGYIREESKPSVDDFLEDPLSSFLQKAQSGSVRKSRLELKSKQRRAAPGNGLTFDDVSESEDLPNARDALNWAQKIRLCDNSLQLVSGRIPNDSTHSPKKIGMHQTPDKNLQEKALSSNAVQDVSLTPILKDLNMRSSDNRNVGHHEAISEDSVPTSFLQRSQSCLSACSSKTSRLRHRGCVQEGPQLDPRDSDHLHDRYTKEFLYVKMKNDVSLPIQVPTLEIQNPQDGSRTIVLAHKVVEKSNSVSDAGVGNVGFNGCDGLGHVPGRCVEDPELESNQNQPSDDLAKGTSVPNHDYLSGDTEANEASSLFITPGRSESYTEDEEHLPDTEFKDRKQLGVQRAASLLDSHLAEDGDQSSRARETFNFSSNTVTEADNGGIAAVSAGLKASAAGPIEKIRFKELLKRKGGLQEYLQCRNQILGLWRKDVSRILPLTECGVTANPSVDEPRHTSLVRDIYAFLDQNGYINVGVASEKDRAEPSSMHYFKLLKGKNFGEKAGATDGDTDDGVSFIVGRVRSSDVSMGAKKGDILDDHSRAVGVTKDGRLATLQTMDLSTLAEPDVCRAGQLHDNGSGDAKYPRRMVDVKVLSSNPSGEVLDGGAVPAMTPEPTKHLYGVRSASNDGGEETHTMQCGSEVRKRVIVIGAGPAGLTAARHLRRQGFSVAVLEARSRIGGRVYTDRSSLSVPVDLGASIITGVEADVATERRPDPSSLVCAQLGLELTVLNSDCPLYDIVTGEKVPADLDEALEVEYNCLIDDLVLLVAQKGERAMKMSLEDGLEYALKRRRMARLGRKCVESELHNSADALLDSEASVDGKVSENNSSKEDILSALERRVMDWHYAHLEYGCAALLKEVSLPYWNQDDVYGGFGGAHCMIKGGYSTVVESLGKGLCIHLNHVVTDISYGTKDCTGHGIPGNEVKVSTSNGSVFWCEAVLVTVPLGCLKAEAIKFSPPLPPWKNLSIQRLGFGVLNKVVLEFSEVFWDDSVDYFGATAEKTNNRGQCFMFWNIKKTVGAPVLIALVVGKAAIDGQKMSSSNHVNNALTVLRELFGEAAVPDPVASVVTDWGKDPFSYGAYSYVAVGASGEDYDILGRPVENCLFFAGEATCKEHPDTVGGAMISGLREAVRIIDILNAGHDYTAEGEAMDAAERHSESEMNEVCDIVRRLEAVDISNVMYRNTLDGAQSLARETLLEEMFSYAKTTAGRLHLAKELLNLPVEVLKSFTGTKEGLSTLNSWILDSMGKDGTQLLRHCVRILVLVSTDLLAVRLSGIGKTVREKVCVHTSRDIRAIASQLVNMWIEVFRKEKASNGGLKLLRQLTAADASKSKSLSSGKPPLRMHHGPPDNKESSQISSFAGSHLPRSATVQRENVKPVKLEIKTDPKLEGKLSRSRGWIRRENATGKEGHNFVMSEEEQAAFAAAEAARAAALAAAEAYASSEAKCNTSLPLPKILSFHKFAIRDQYTQRDESDFRRKWSDGERQECTSEIDSRNCRVRDWSVDFSAAGVNIDSSKRSIDNLSQQSHSNEIACQSNFRGHSPERGAVDSSIFTKAWVDADGSMGIKDSNAIDRWQSQAAAAESDFFHRAMQIRDEEDSNMNSKLSTCRFGQLANESSVSQVTVNKELVANQPKGADHIKQAVVDYVASLLMPLYKAKKIEKEGYKSIMKKTATKVMELTTDGEKAMAVYEFLDFKRKNKIRSFVDTMIERHMATKQVAKP